MSARSFSSGARSVSGEERKGGTTHRVRHDELEDDPREARMGFLDHLEELRTRIIRSCIAIALGMAIAFFFVERLADFILAPTLAALPPGASLVFLRPGEGFSFRLDIALIGGIVVAAPFVTYQVWRFIAPGLYARERKFVAPIVALAAIGTIAGAAFSHYALYPAMMAFFRSFDSPRVRFTPRLEDTFDLYKNMLIGMVTVFQIPTLVFFLAKLRLVTARFLWKQIKYAVLFSFIAAAVLTPSADPWNQIVFAAPMIALYIVSIGLAWLVGPRRERAEAATSRSDVELPLVAAATILKFRKKSAIGNLQSRI